MSKIENLIHIILHPEDYRDGSKALRDLRQLNPVVATDLARAVLVNEDEEIHYRSFAMHMLYSLSREEALNYICHHADSANIHMVDTMLDEVTYDPEHESNSLLFREAVRKLARILKAKTHSSKDLDRFAKTVEEFKKTFPIEMANS